MSSSVARSSHYSEESRLEDIQALLLNMRTIYDPLDSAIQTPLYKVHGSQNALSQAIGSFIAENPQVFSDTITTEEKAKVVFDAYREAYLTVIQTTVEYQKALERLKGSLLNKMGSDAQLEEVVKRLTFHLILTFHTTTVELALKIHFKVDRSPKIQVWPDRYESRKSCLDPLTSFFRETIFSPHEDTLACRQLEK